jgi:hypothetical protein
MTSQFESVGVMEASLHQGSCAACLRAEKGRSHPNGVQPPNPVLPCFRRLDGANPHGYCVRPTSQHFREILTRTRARTRIRGRATIVFSFDRTTKQVRQVRRLDKPNVYKGFSRLTFRPTKRRLDG